MRANNSRTPLAVAGVALLAVVLVGALLATLGSPGQGSEAVVVTQPAASGPYGSVSTEGRVGDITGFTRDSEGASRAAVAYATASQEWLYLTDQQITAAVTAIATQASAQRLASDVVDDVRTARERLGKSAGRVWWLVRPLAWRVSAQTPDEATVEVWIVTVLSAQEVAAPQTEFATVTVELAWSDDDWRVDAVRDTPGPTPMTGPNDQPWDTEPFDKSLNGFTRIDGEPVR
jgi:hypothetical protein